MSAAMKNRDWDSHPTPLRYLYESSARQRLVDFFLEFGAQWEEGDDPLTKKDIIQITDMQRRSVIDHIPVLVEMGVVKVNTEHRHDRYEPHVESEPFNILIHANNTLGEYYEKQHSEE
jgi:hypothetical protein